MTDKSTYQYFDQQLIQRCTDIQYKLLKKAITLLKPNHEMIYSTCSILKEENEDVLDRVLKEEKIEIVPIDNFLFKDIPLLPSKTGTITVMPNNFYEGFFIAKLRKISSK